MELIFALSYAEVKEVDPLSFQEVFRLSFSMQLQKTEGDQQDTQRAPPLQTHTNSTQPQAKFFHQNDKTPWFCSREHLLLPRKRHKASRWYLVFFSLAERSQPPVLQFHVGFSLSVLCSHFWDSPDTPAQCVPLWLGRENLHPALQGCHCLINQLG